MDIEDLRRRMRLIQTDATDFNEFFRVCIEQAISRISETEEITAQKKRQLSHDLVDACFLEFERRSKDVVEKSEEKKYVPMEIRIIHDALGNPIQCECCRHPATRTQFDTSNSTTHCFCDWHTIKCKQKLSKEKIEELNEKKELKTKPYKNWPNERKLDAGLYCPKCFSKSGELVEIVPGTCRCPRCGGKQ